MSAPLPEGGRAIVLGEGPRRVRAYRAVVEFAVAYDLPEGVAPSAVINAIKGATVAVVRSLEVLGSDENGAVGE